MEKLLLIDGHSILHRAFYGMPDLTNAAGTHTGAVYGFLNILFKLMEEETPDYLAVAFDVHAPTFRHEVYKEYKGTRKPMPPELREQVPLIKKVLRAMDVFVCEQEGLEGDDILGTLAKKAEAEGMQVSLVSGDRDLLQIASGHILIRIPKTSRGQTTIRDYHAEEVLQEYRVTPEQFIHVKALMGDSSDNVPGVPKVGEKTATELIAAYGSVDGVYAHLEDIHKKGLRETLRENEEKARLSLFLVTIRTDGDITLDRSLAKVSSFYTEAAYALFSELGFKNYLNRFPTAQIGEEAFSYEIIFEKESLQKLLDDLRKQERVSVFPLYDRGSLHGSGDLAGIAVSFGERNIYIQIIEDLHNSITTAEACAFLKELRRAAAEMQDRQMLIVFDAKNQYEFYGIERETEFSDGIRLEGILDMLVACYLINPMKNDYTPEDIAQEYLGKTEVTSKRIFDKKKIREVLETDEEAAETYGCRMARDMLEAAPAVRERLQEMGMWELYTEIERPLTFVLHDMEDRGIRIDSGALKEYGEELTGRITELEKLIHQAAGDDTFNISSPKQLGVILFEKLGLPGSKKTKSGYSTSADILEKLSGEYPIVADILEYRGLTKLKSTYAEGLAAYIAPDSRIHTTYNQTVAATGRLSSNEPNLQNIPMRTELGKKIRKCFLPQDGFIFTDADYSQIELRILAHMSGDEDLIAAYRENEDIHRITASKVFHTPLEQVTPQQRSNAKAVNFGIIYGISSFGLSQGLSISRKEAAEYIRAYFATYPSIKKFLDGLVEEAKETGYARTIFGRRRPVPELHSSNFMQRQFGERIAMNSPLQGSAADIMKIAMIHVWEELKRRGLRSEVILQIHDELLVETAPGEEAAVAEILEEQMKGAADLRVMLEVDVESGSDWYMAK